MTEISLKKRLEHLSVDNVQELYAPKAHALKSKPKNNQTIIDPNDPALYSKDLESLRQEIKEAKSLISDLQKDKKGLTVKIRGFFGY